MVDGGSRCKKFEGDDEVIKWIVIKSRNPKLTRHATHTHLGKHACHTQAPTPSRISHVRTHCHCMPPEINGKGWWTEAVIGGMAANNAHAKTIILKKGQAKLASGLIWEMAAGWHTTWIDGNTL